MNSFDEFLTGGDELFDNPRFVNHFNYMLKEYIPPIDKPIALFLSCSKYKPYYKSPYRRVFNAMIEKKLQIRDLSQIYTISEPAIIIPEELDDTNITHYDFPPDKLQKYGREIFIDRLVEILPKIFRVHKISFYILPKHHREIFENALKKILQKNKYNLIEKQIIYAPPLTYNLPKARKIIEDALKNKKSKINK